MLRAVARQISTATIAFALAFPSFASPSFAATPSALPKSGPRSSTATTSGAPSVPVRSSAISFFESTSHRDSDDSASALRPLIERYSADRVSLFRKYDAPLSEVRRTRFKRFYEEWLGTLEKLDFDRLDQEAKVDYLLFDNHLRDRLRDLALREKQDAELSPLLPFAKIIVDLDESRRRMEIPKPEQAAAALSQMVKEISKAREAAEAGIAENGKPAETSQVADHANGTSGSKTADPARAADGGAPQPIHATKFVSSRAAATVPKLRELLKRWFQYYGGYHPLFTWWVSEPYKEADQALDGYVIFLKEKLVGIKADDKTAIIGQPVGREELQAELAAAMIPYTPEELIGLAKNEMAWCTREMIRASHDMGFGDDWHKALEHVKDMHVEPGEQPEAIRKLALEGIDYVESHDLVTVPPLAKETWRWGMMTPERQLVNPFFTGGDVISISYPTDTMTFEQRMMSMRGNNIPFSRATVFHELIPGHYLQQFMNERYRNYREVFETPFWSEGNAFYWEMLLWNLGIPKTPEERAGMLFWRMHRCARIIFTMNFHLGLWTPQQCVDFLVNNVGHERDNAAAEVRRSFNGSVPALYQSAYMLGALQFRALHADLVDSGKMSNRNFHDAILHEGQMPIEMLRAILTNQKLSRNFQTGWKFYGTIPASP
jgi:Bacterial protein of unknown function (DUF885)